VHLARSTEEQAQVGHVNGATYVHLLHLTGRRVKVWDQLGAWCDLGIAIQRSKTNIWLVVLYNHLGKYEFVSWEYSSQYEKMFQSTNQTYV
jgi:hypothetical protein